jgi:Flp pilus assembly protein TadB
LSQTLPADVYQMTAQVTDSLGAQSLVTLPININVKQKEFLRIGSLVLNYLSVIIMLILAIASVLAFIFLTVHHLVLFRRKLRRDLKNLKEDFKEEIELLETAKLGRKLTKEESLILKKLSGKKLTDLEKDVK